MKHSVAAWLSVASLVNAQLDSDWCGAGSNQCTFTGQRLTDLACGWCRSWTLASNIAGNTLRVIGLDGGALPGDGNSANVYMAQVSLDKNFVLSNGSAWTLEALPSNVPNLRDGALWASRDNSTAYAFGGRAPTLQTVPDNGAVPQLAVANQDWTLPIRDLMPGRFYAGAAVNVPQRQVAYYLGGFQDNTSSKSVTDGLHHYATEMFAFNTTTGSISSFDAPFLPVQSGAIAYLPYGDLGSLVYFGGESPSSYVVADCSNCSVNAWDHVQVYDIKNQQWHRQNTTGSVQPRSDFCTATIYDEKSKSWQIWTMGGMDVATQTVLSSVTVLSIPSFQWFSANSSNMPRMSVSCQAYGPQIFVVGGRTENTAAGGSGYPAPAYIYDANRQAMASTFDHSSTAYTAPASIQAAIAISSTPAAWADAAVQTLFANVVATPSITPSTTPSATTSAFPSSATLTGSASLPAGIIAGIVIGCIALLALLGVASFLLWRRRRKTRSRVTHSPIVTKSNQGYEKAELAATVRQSKVTRSELPAPQMYHQLDSGHDRWEMDASKPNKHHIYEMH